MMTENGSNQISEYDPEQTWNEYLDELTTKFELMYLESKASPEKRRGIKEIIDDIKKRKVTT